MQKIKYLLFISIILYSCNRKSSSNNNSSSTESISCVGDKGCITKVRQNFNNTGKRILGEEYLENGKFGISFLDPNRGETYNAVVTTDCNCGLTDVDVSVMP